MPARRLILLLCLTGATTTVSIGAFPALLPEMGAAVGLADWQLGAVASAFGRARMLSNVPSGLFITHHLARALILSPGLMLLGALLLAGGGGFATLLLGRALMVSATRCACWATSPRTSCCCRRSGAPCQARRPAGYARSLPGVRKNPPRAAMLVRRRTDRVAHWRCCRGGRDGDGAELCDRGAIRHSVARQP